MCVQVVLGIPFPPTEHLGSSADEPDEEETTHSEEVEGILNWVFGSD